MFHYAPDHSGGAVKAAESSTAGSEPGPQSPIWQSPLPRGYPFLHFVVGSETRVRLVTMGGLFDKRIKFDPFLHVADMTQVYGNCAAGERQRL